MRSMQAPDMIDAVVIANSANTSQNTPVNSSPLVGDIESLHGYEPCTNANPPLTASLRCPGSVQGPSSGPVIGQNGKPL